MISFSCEPRFKMNIDLNLKLFLHPPESTFKGGFKISIPRLTTGRYLSPLLRGDLGVCFLIYLSFRA